MFHVVLFEPEIPPNTGNIMRLCANCGSRLHLIKPLGFDMDDKKLRRAGLDYAEWSSVLGYDSLHEFMGKIDPAHLFAFTTRGTRNYADILYQPGDAFLFGPETRGLPDTVLNDLLEEQRIFVPMVSQSRCLNLSNTVAIVLYEAWRQNGFLGL